MKNNRISKDLLKEIDHPIIKEALVKRHSSFIFSYGDEGSRHNDRPGYSEWRDKSSGRKHREGGSEEEDDKGWEYRIGNYSD